MFIKKFHILYIHMTRRYKKGQTLDVVSRVILSQIFFNIKNLHEMCNEQLLKKRRVDFFVIHIIFISKVPVNNF